ncbi:MAG: hypothetical protein ACYS1A_08310 [Planctomycetota bacterium]|jgi:hypothetical protein
MAAYWMTTAERIKHRRGPTFSDFKKYILENDIKGIDLIAYCSHFNINYNEMHRAIKEAEVSCELHGEAETPLA